MGFGVVMFGNVSYRYPLGFVLLLAITLSGCMPENRQEANVNSDQPESQQLEQSLSPVDSTDLSRDTTQQLGVALLDADTENLWTRDGEDWPGFLGMGRDGSQRKLD